MGEITIYRSTKLDKTRCNHFCWLTSWKEKAISDWSFPFTKFTSRKRFFSLGISFFILFSTFLLILFFFSCFLPFTFIPLFFPIESISLYLYASLVWSVSICYQVLAIRRQNFTTYNCIFCFSLVWQRYLKIYFDPPIRLSLL